MIMFAFSGAAIAAWWAAYGATALTVASVATMAVGAGMSIYSGYQANAAAKTSARMQTDAANAAANAQRMAAEAQAQQLRDQADLAGIQASAESKRAGVAQERGEVEARRRMIQLSYDIGSVYSQAAGSGLLVDGGGDTVGQILTANVREAAQDVGIAKANAANEVWEHDMNRTSALLTQKSYLAQSGSARRVGEMNAGATLLSGEAQAYATRQAGLTALYQGWGTGLQMLGSAASGASGLAGGASGAAAFGGNTARMGGWSGTNSAPTWASSAPRTGIA